VRCINEGYAASTEEDKVLAGLDPKDLKVSSRVEGCMDGTREDILNTINDWILDLEAPQNILWVKGYPGAGKSTVASSVVEHLRGSKRLGSYFFFHRGKATDQMSHAFWRSVAFDLSRRYPTVRKHLVRKLADDGDIPTIPNVDELFRQIIQEPLEDSGGILPVIVIDALDECGGLDGRHSHHRKGILRTLLTWSKLPRRLKMTLSARYKTSAM
jgi:NACHT domain